MKTVIIILIVISLGLGVGLLVRHQKAEAQRGVAARENSRLNSELEEARLKFEEQKNVATLLETNLSLRAQELVATANDLATVKLDLSTAHQQVKAAQDEVQKRDERIAQLEDQRDDMTKKLDELASSINTLEGQIGDTKKKLASAEGDRDYLVKELSRLQTEKAGLVRQFNDITVLRAQVAKLRDEAATNQRLDWMQKGIYSQRDRKGAEMLASRAIGSVPRMDRRLDVELHQEGGVRAVDSSTNAPTKP